MNISILFGASVKFRCKRAPLQWISAKLPANLPLLGGNSLKSIFSNRKFCPFPPIFRRKFGFAEAVKTSGRQRKDGHKNGKENFLHHHTDLLPIG